MGGGSGTLDSFEGSDVVDDKDNSGVSYVLNSKSGNCGDGSEEIRVRNGEWVTFLTQV